MERFKPTLTHTVTDNVGSEPTTVLYYSDTSNAQHHISKKRMSVLQNGGRGRSTSLFDSFTHCTLWIERELVSNQSLTQKRYKYSCLIHFTNATNGKPPGAFVVVAGTLLRRSVADLPRKFPRPIRVWFVVTWYWDRFFSYCKGFTCEYRSTIFPHSVAFTCHQQYVIKHPKNTYYSRIYNGRGSTDLVFIFVLCLIVGWLVC
jgi:hypothetical protein